MLLLNNKGEKLMKQFNKKPYHDIIADLDAILEKNRRKANRYVIVTIVIAVGVLFAITFMIWLWTPIDASGSLASVSLALIITLGALYLQGYLTPNNFYVDDQTLAHLAAADIIDNASFTTLKDLLQKQGYITLGQVNDFLEGERRARELAVALGNPGAKALLSYRND